MAVKMADVIENELLEQLDIFGIVEVDDELVKTLETNKLQFNEAVAMVCLGGQAKLFEVSGMTDRVRYLCKGMFSENDVLDYHARRLDVDLLLDAVDGE